MNRGNNGNHTKNTRSIGNTYNTSYSNSGNNIGNMSSFVNGQIFGAFIIAYGFGTLITRMVQREYGRS